MQANMGSADRIIRVLIAIAIAVLYLLNLISGTVAIILLFLAGVFILTSFMSYCPLYAPFNFRTNAKKKPTA